MCPCMKHAQYTSRLSSNCEFDWDEGRTSFILCTSKFERWRESGLFTWYPEVPFLFQKWQYPNIDTTQSISSSLVGYAGRLVCLAIIRVWSQWGSPLLITPRRRRGSVVLVRSVAVIETRTSANSASLRVTKENLPSVIASCFEDRGWVDMVHVKCAWTSTNTRWTWTGENIAS